MSRRFLILYIATTVAIISSCSEKQPEYKEPESKVPDNFVLVKGGTFVNTKSNLYGKRATIRDFYIGKYEVTQKEWMEVMASNPSKFKGDSLPVETVSWYDCIEYCNKKSLKENLEPYYRIDKDNKDLSNKNDLDSLKWTVTINKAANGYRLPTETEWEYAAGGGQLSESYTYSGGHKIDDVAWYWQNSGDKYLLGMWSAPAIEGNHNKTNPIGRKKPNELGLYDMAGNVREWCEDWYEDEQTTIGTARVWRGGGWMGADFTCEPTFRYSHEANGAGPDQGFRLCRSR